MAGIEGFPYDRLQRTLTPEAREVICDLTLSWAAFDTMVSYWMSLQFGMWLDIGSILIGNMDTKTKLDRMVSLCIHVGAKARAANINRLRKQHEKFVETRNIVMHRKCLGHYEDKDCTRLLFQSAKHIRGKVDEYEMMAVDLNALRAATEFADNACNNIFEITGPMAERMEQARAQRQGQGEPSPDIK